ncbi:MAG: radical SAM protein [Candidatus Woesearchaeota archaeon]
MNLKNMRIAFVDLNESIKFGEISSNLYLASYLLEKINKKVEIKLYSSFEKFRKYGGHYDLICFSVNGLNLQKLPKKIKEEIKQIKSIKIIGGPGPTIIPQPCLEFCDIVVIGEGEIPLKKIVKLMIKKEIVKTEELLNCPELKKIENILYQVDGKIILTPKKNYDKIDFVSRKFDLITDLEEHIKNWPYMDYFPKRRGISIITSRSCGFNCSFCQPTLKKIFGEKIKYIPIEIIKKELIELNQKYKIDAFMAHDDNLTANYSHLRNFCNMLNELKREGIEFKWICNSRCDTIDEEKIKLLAKANCVEIRYGIETWNENIRSNFLNKKISNKKVYDTIKLTKNHNILCFGFFMLGYPNLKIKDVLNEIITTANSDLDLATFSVLTPLPGTELGIRYNVDSFENYYLGNSKVISNINPFVIELLKKFAFLAFYFHPTRLKRSLLELISGKNLKYKIRRFFFY